MIRAAQAPFRRPLPWSGRTGFYFGCAGAGAGCEPGRFGVGTAGAVGDGAFGALGLGGAAGAAAVPLRTVPGPRWPMIASASAPTMNSTARIAVPFESTVAPVRAPKADWLLPPPN